jgi:glutamate racemase
VLACTHFPLLRDDLAAVSPDGMNFVDSGDGIARRTHFLLQGQEWTSPVTGIAVFTKDSEDLSPLRPALERYGLATLDIL